MAQELLDQSKCVAVLVWSTNNKQDESVLCGRFTGHGLIIGYQLGQVGDGR
jgi:hypothetical protein